MAKKIMVDVKVVGMTHSGFDVSVLSKNDKVVLKTGTYPKDPTAIKVETTSGDHIGYVAASAATALTYTIAKDIFDSVTNGQVVKVVKAELDELVITIPKVEASNTKTIKVSGLLVGNKMEYPARMVAMMAIKKGSCKLEFRATDNRIVVVYDGVAAGYISTEVTAAASKILTSAGMQLSKSDSEVYEAVTGATNVTITANFVDATIIPIEFICEVESIANVNELNDEEFNELLKKFEAADQDEIKKRLDWLRENKTSEYAIKLFVDRIKNHQGIAPFQPCYIVQSKEMENAIAFSHGIGVHRGNILLAGPAGSGKNMFIITFANLMDLQLIDKSCSAGVDEEAVFGFLSMKASEEKPDAQAVNLAFKRMLKSSNFAKIDNKKEFASLDADAQVAILKELSDEDDFDYSVLFDAMRSQTAEIQFEPSVLTKGLEVPSLINFDEVNTLRATVTSALHSALDKRRSVLVNGYKTVEIDSEVIFTATMNEGSEYAGTAILNLAFEDRWHVLEFEAPESMAAILKQEVPTIDSKTVKILDELYKKMKSIRGVEIADRSFSQRAFIYCAINVALGNDLKSAILATIIPKIRDTEDRESVKGLVDLMLK